MTDTASAIAAALERPRYEVIPLEGLADAVRVYVPHEVTVTVTASPSKGLGPTLALTEELAAAGYAVVPHVAARLVEDEAHLRSMLSRLERAGIDDVLVIAGDVPRPVGVFEGAADLLRAMARLGPGLRAIGITGYPESHPLIDDETTIRAMFEKAEHATYITSQICFDPRVTAQWIENVWARGTRLPIYIGVPGVVHLTKLLRVSARIGLGDSVRFLRKQGARMRHLLRPTTYTPDELLRGLAPVFSDPEGKVAGIHVFTFNELEATERWRQEQLARLALERA